MNTVFGSTNSGKKRTPFYPNDSILESLRDLGSGVTQSVKKDVAGKVAHDTFTTLTTGGLPNYGELSDHNAGGIPKERHQELRQTTVRHESTDEHRIKTEQARVQQQIEAVRNELKALSASLGQLNQEINRAIDQAPAEPGQYHLNFYDRLRSVISNLRQQVEDSRTWLHLTSGRKKQKNYWGMYKKHGTQFGLSSERTAATQSG